jgi:hypothetical protein
MVPYELLGNVTSQGYNMFESHIDFSVTGMTSCTVHVLLQ